MKKYKLIIFDLIDTLAYCKGLSEHEVRLEQSLGKEIVSQFIDGGSIDTLKSVNDAMDTFRLVTPLSPIQEELVRTWLSWPESYLFDDSIQILKYLKDAGYRVAIISNSPPTDCDQLVDLGIDKYIDEVIFSFDVGTRKPEKEIFLSLLERAMVKPSEALMIGDSLKNDIRGASAVGIDSLLLDRNDTSSYKPKITSLLQLRDFLDQTNF
jgi:HAD superfamily hydrolase (TIGR01549 family)